MCSSRKLPFRLSAILVFAIFAAAVVTACSGESASPKIEAAEGAVVSSAPFPTENEAAGWKPADDVETFTGDRLFEHLDGGADIYYEYGFQALALREYTQGEKAVSLEIYRMSDPAAAFGIYSYNRQPSLSPAEVGSDAVIHPNGLFFWQDSYYVDLRQLGSTAVPPEAMLALARAVSKKIGATADKPRLMDLLPQANKVPRTEVFARGKLGINNQVYVSDDDLFGLKKGEGAALARYRLGQPEFSVIIASYADESACDDAYTRFHDHFIGGGGGQGDSFTASTMPGKHNAVGKSGRNLVVVANADSDEHALAMLHEVLESLKNT